LSVVFEIYTRTDKLTDAPIAILEHCTPIAGAGKVKIGLEML